MSGASSVSKSPDRGANYHSLWATTTRKVVSYALPTFRVECTCGWESDWNYDWIKSLDGHIRREQKKAQRGR